MPRRGRLVTWIRVVCSGSNLCPGSWSIAWISYGITTWKKSATISQSAECGAAVVSDWYASLPKHDTVSVVAARMRIYLWLETQ